MKMAKIGLACAVVNRLLYTIGIWILILKFFKISILIIKQIKGGFDGRDRLNQVEVYNPDQNLWTFAAPMLTARSGAGWYFRIVYF